MANKEDLPGPEIEIAGGRPNVGARNPFALAEAILLKKKMVETHINWVDLPPETARNYLARAFDLEYPRLFDQSPDIDSPLFRGVKLLGRKNLALAAGTVITGTKTMPVDRKVVALEKKAIPPGKMILPLEVKTPPLPQVGSGMSWCTQAVNNWISNQANNAWVYPPGGGTDPMVIRQGCAPDCYFIAALISFAWTAPASLSGAPDPANPGCHLYTFRETPIGTGTRCTVSTPQLLAVDSSQRLVFSRPANNTSVWPSLYEKAYAIFRKQDSSRPAVNELGFYNPVAALWEVTGASVSSRDVVSFYDAATKSFRLANLLTDIRAKGGNISTSGGRTTKAMVAWTFFNGTSTPFGDAYTDDLVVANHAYSILGTTKVNNVDCIVLRNPYGFSTGTSKAGVFSCQPAWYTAGFTISDGNFAMTVDAFTRYFQGYAFRL